MFHVGGQSVYYNPFTPPPTNQSTFHQWTVGPIYYANLVASEVFGPSNTSQIVDLDANGGNVFTPGYAVYDKGVPKKIALFNYITDPTGASTYTASITVTGGTVPSSVQVKYLQASSVSELSNITWAGQTFGGTFASDGRLQGDMVIQTVQCDTSSNTCPITVPAPSVALVFLDPSTMYGNTGNTEGDVNSGDGQEGSTLTFSTTVYTRTQNTATVAASVLATSNGHSGMDVVLWSTSQGSNGAQALSPLTGLMGLRGVVGMGLGVAGVLVGVGVWML